MLTHGQTSRDTHNYKRPSLLPGDKQPTSSHHQHNTGPRSAGEEAEADDYFEELELSL